MPKNQIDAVKLAYFRSLMSQSAASLTMGSVAAFLRLNGYKTDICLLERGNPHNFEWILTGEKTIIIAKPNFKDVLEMIEMLKFVKRSGAVVNIFFCGPYASLNAKSLMDNCPWLDGIIYGSPEITSLKILKSITIKDSQGFTPIDGGMWRAKDSSIVDSFSDPVTVELDEVPFPARDIERKENAGFVNIEASRGCIYGCSFCHLPPMCMFSGPKRMVVRDPKKVVDEIEFLNKKFSKKLFIFNDSCFWRTSADNERIRTICEEILKRQLKIHIYAYLRCNPFIPDELLLLLRKAGLVRVFLGLENMNQSAQHSFNKIIDTNFFAAIKSKLEGQGIAVHIGFMVFEPTATINGIIANIEYLYRIGQLFRIGVILEPMRVVPGTVMHKQLIAMGLLADNLPFSEITYGYKFKNCEVGDLLACYRNIFMNKIGMWGYNFEYWCVTADLLKKLLMVESLKQPELLSKKFAVFEKAQKDCEELIRSGLIEIAKCFNKDGYAPSGKEEAVNEFSRQFSDLSARTGVAYAEILSAVPKKDRGLLREIYSGLERI